MPTRRTPISETIRSVVSEGGSCHDGSVPVAASKGRPLDDELTARVLRYVRESLEDEGFTHLRIERAASAVGCGKTAIYRRWRTKAELAAAAILDGIELGESPDTGDVVEDLLIHAWRHLENFRRPQARERDHNGILLALFDVEVLPLISERYMQRRHEMGRKLIETAITRGEISAAIDVDLVLDAIAGFTLFRLAVKPDAKAATDAELRASYRTLIRSLLTIPADDSGDSL